MRSCLLGSRDAGLPWTSGLSRWGSCRACLASQLPRQTARHARRLVNHDHCAQPDPRAGVAARFFAQLFGLDPSASTRAVKQQFGIYRCAPDSCLSFGPTRSVRAIATVARAYAENHRRSSSSMLSVRSDEVGPETKRSRSVRFRIQCLRGAIHCQHLNNSTIPALCP